MGSAVSCTGGGSLDQGFEALPMRSLSFDRDNVKSTLRSVSFNGRDAEPAILKAFSSGKLIIEGSLSFKEDGEYFGSMESKISIKSPTKAEKESFMKLETKILIESLTAEKESSIKGATLRTSRFNPLNERATVPLNERATVEPSEATIEPSCKKFKAAVKLQKVYKSFKTRRQLVDCAVLVEQRWYARWKLLDFVLLKKSSVSFFDIEEPESVFSRWSRARRRTAKVGKGLSKDEKAQKLALQHWLETVLDALGESFHVHLMTRGWFTYQKEDSCRELGLQSSSRMLRHMLALMLYGNGRNFFSAASAKLQYA